MKAKIVLDVEISSSIFEEPKDLLCMLHDKVFKICEDFSSYPDYVFLWGTGIEKE